MVVVEENVKVNVEVKVRDMAVLAVAPGAARWKPSNPIAPKPAKMQKFTLVVHVVLSCTHGMKCGM